MKIPEIEEKLKTEGFSEELFSAFQVALKRVPKASRSQHCYTIACELSPKHMDGAVRFIEYGLAYCENTWLDLVRSYLNLGIVYENGADYLRAKNAYQNALSAIPDTQKEAYAPSVSMNVLRTALHVNNFTYSHEIEALYHAVSTANEFEANLRHFIFYKAIAQMIISAHKNDSAAHQAAYVSARAVLKNNTQNPLDAILAKHRYKNEAKATKEALKYLTSQRKGSECKNKQ